MKKKSTGLNSILKSDSPNQSRMGLTEDDLFSSINFFNKRVDDSHNENSSPAINSLHQNRQMVGVENKNFFDYLNFNYDKEKLLINTKEITKYENKRFDSMKKISSRIKVAQTVMSAADLNKFYDESIDFALNQILPKISNIRGTTNIPTNFGPLKGSGVTWNSIFGGFEEKNMKKISSRQELIDKLAAQGTVLPPSITPAGMGGGRFRLGGGFTQADLNAMGPEEIPLKPQAPAQQPTSLTRAAPPPTVAPRPGGVPEFNPSFNNPGRLTNPALVNPNIGSPPPNIGSSPPVKPVLDNPNPTGHMDKVRGNNPLVRYKPPQATPGTVPPSSGLPAIKPPSGIPRITNPNRLLEVGVQDTVTGFNPPKAVPKVPSKMNWGIAAFLAGLAEGEFINQSAATTYGKDLAGIFGKEFRKMNQIFISKYNGGQSFGDWAYAKISGGMSPQQAVDIWFKELNDRGIPEVFSGSVNSGWGEAVRNTLKGIWNIISILPFIGSGSELLTSLNSEAIAHANESVGLMRDYVSGKVSGGQFISMTPPLSGGASAGGSAMTTTPPPTSSSPDWIKYDNALKQNKAKMVGSISNVHDLWNKKQPVLAMAGYDPSFASFTSWYKAQNFPNGSNGIQSIERELSSL